MKSINSAIQFAVGFVIGLINASCFVYTVEK